MFCFTIAAAAPRKTRGQLSKLIDADYYGYRDDEDGTLLPGEREDEEKCEYHDSSRILTTGWNAVEPV